MITELNEPTYIKLTASCLGILTGKIFICITTNIDYFNLISIIKEVILMATAVIGSYVALQGLSSWKKQLVGNKKFKTIHELLIATYELRDAISITRLPSVSINEIEYGNSNSSNKSYIYDGTKNAYTNRWAKVLSAKTKIDIKLLSAEVLLGDEIRSRYQKLNQKVAELYNNLNHYIASKEPSPDASAYRNMFDRDIIYSKLKNDKYEIEFNEIIKDIETFLKPYL